METLWAGRILTPKRSIATMSYWLGLAEVAGGGRCGGEEREDVCALVVTTLNQCIPGLDVDVSDIDCTHRLPGPNNRVIVRFVRSGQDNVRDQVMSRRLELRGRDLYLHQRVSHQVPKADLQVSPGCQALEDLHGLLAGRIRLPKGEAARRRDESRLATTSSRSGLQRAGALVLYAPPYL